MLVKRISLLFTTATLGALPMPASALTYIQVGASTGFNGDWVDTRSRGYSSDNGSSHGYDSVNGEIVTNKDLMPNYVGIQSETSDSLAYATVDLAKYKISSYAAGFAYARGEIYDDLVFTVEQANELTLTTFSVLFSLHSVNPTFDEAVLSAYIGDMWGYLLVANGVDGVTDASFAEEDVGIGYRWSDGDTYYMKLTQSFTGPIFNTVMWVHSDAVAYGGVSDFSQTTSVEFLLPENVSMVSGSGKVVIGGDPVTPAVPEPSTWISMMMGLGLLGGFLRRRIKAPRPDYA